tara:strand:+ start:40 stop:1311 length:1272 start_codon:yes stop_codon:yes gene_type:complete
MKNILFTLALLISFNSFGQTWKYSEGTSAFDGKYKTSIVTGAGNNFPYNNPSLVINQFEGESINFYISDGGFFQEKTGIKVLWVFDNEPDRLYSTYDYSISSDGKILFFTEFNNPDGSGKLKPVDIIEKLTLANKVTVRISDDYSSNDIVFSLRGSTKAINFVIPKEERQQMLDSGLAERNALAEVEVKNQLILENLMKKANEEKLTSSSLSSLKSQFEQDLGLSYYTGMGTGKNYKSISVDIYNFDALKRANSRGYTEDQLKQFKATSLKMFYRNSEVKVFYVLEDGSKEEIYGTWKVEMDAPIFVRLEKEKERVNLINEKEKERVNLILEKYSNEALREAIIKEIGRFSRQGYSEKGHFEFIDVKGVMITFRGNYKKFDKCYLKIQLTNSKVINATVFFMSGLEITKKMLKSMGGEIGVAF